MLVSRPTVTDNLTAIGMVNLKGRKSAALQLQPSLFGAPCKASLVTQYSSIQLLTESTRYLRWTPRIVAFHWPEIGVILLASGKTASFRVQDAPTRPCYSLSYVNHQKSMSKPLPYFSLLRVNQQLEVSRMMKTQLFCVEGIWPTSDRVYKTHSTPLHSLLLVHEHLLTWIRDLNLEKSLHPNLRR